MATMSLSESLKVGLETFPVFISCITEPGSPGTPALPVWGLGVCEHHCSAGNESPWGTQLCPPPGKRKGEVRSGCDTWQSAKWEWSGPVTDDKRGEETEGPSLLSRPLTHNQELSEETVTHDVTSLQGVQGNLPLTPKGCLIPEFTRRNCETFCVASPPRVKYHRATIPAWNRYQNGVYNLELA